MSSDEDFVSFGTPLEPLEDDELPPSKKQVYEQTVHDEKGRQRFHGAFTGGFSAGYFNTVGSKEGWAPSSFTSSRSQKSNKFQQNPEDFMDDEDLGAFGIAPRKVQTTTNFHRSEHASRKRDIPSSSLDGPIPGEPPLKELVKPLRESIGVKLLQKMGWRLGQGIGPRQKRKQKLVYSEIKIYGCAPPPNQRDSEDDDEEDDPYAADYTFAPKDIKALPYSPKDNLFGIGYSGLNKDLILSSHINLFEPTKTKAVIEKKKKLTISGQAFGVGAFEEDDDDIYAKDDMTQYNFTLEETFERSKEKNVSHENKIIHHIRKVIEGFHLASKPTAVKPKYPPPSLPPDFKPVHHPMKKMQLDAPVENRFLDRHNMDAQKRSSLLEEKPSSSKKFTTGSIFDLLSSQDKAKLEQGKKNLQQKQVSQSIDSKEKEKSSSFKPFLNDKAKQARYEQYLSLMQMGSKDCLSAIQPQSLTEWEKQREKEEFQRAAMLYQPLSSSLSSRFVSSYQLENDREIQIRIDEQEDKKEQKKAANMKMFGKLTREKFEWHPARVLCKRFNVPNPYPDCTMVGLPKVKRDKYSLFNFLTAPTQTDTKKSAAKLQESSNQCDHKEELDSPSSHNKSTEIREESRMDMKVKKLLEENTEERDPKPSMDLFKAIFQNTSEEESSSSSEDEMPPTEQSSATNFKETVAKNQLHTEETTVSSVSLTSAEKPKRTGFGVFANIDFDVLNQQTSNTSAKKDDSKDIQNTATITIESKSFSPARQQTPSISEDDTYGPKLPPTSHILVSSSFQDQQKKEANQNSFKKHKKEKHHKHKKHKSKSKKERHKEKHKHKKSNERRQKASTSEETSDSDVPSNQQILQRLHQLQKSWNV